MNRRLVLMIVLLVVGVAIIGGGVAALVNQPKSINIPNKSPAIATDATYANSGDRDRLFIYDDGTVIYVEDRVSDSGSSSRAWKTGTLDAGDLAALLSLTEKPEFAALANGYSFLGDNMTDGTPRAGDLDLIVSVNNGNVKRVMGFYNYYSPDHETVYPDLPYPVGDIYEQMKTIAANKTVKFER